ncbi:MAG: 50S ribosomal protein L21, partial [Candidatus Blackburnbacteria bacterium RIFCSPLOWO2_02_FULL_44_9]
MKYAVVKSNGKQYKAEEGKELLLEAKYPTETKNVDLDEVLLVTNEDKVSIGEPLVKGAKVLVSVMGEEKGEK